MRATVAGSTTLYVSMAERGDVGRPHRPRRVGRVVRAGHRHRHPARGEHAARSSSSLVDRVLAVDPKTGSTQREFVPINAGRSTTSRPRCARSCRKPATPSVRLLSGRVRVTPLTDEPASASAALRRFGDAGSLRTRMRPWTSRPAHAPRSSGGSSPSSSRCRRSGRARRPEAGRGVRRSALPPSGHGGPEERSAGARLVEPVHARRRSTAPGSPTSSTRRCASSWAARRSRRKPPTARRPTPATWRSSPSSARRYRCEQFLAAAPRRRDPLVLRDDRAVRRQLRRHQHPEPHRARRRPLRHQRAQVVHERRGVEALHVRHPHGRVGSQRRPPSSPQHGAHPARHAGRDDRALAAGVRARPRMGSLRDALRERAHPEGVPPRRRGRRLRDRAGAARPRSDPPLHARDRHGRACARAHVQARAEAGHVRQAPRRPGRDPGAHRRVAHRDRAGAAPHHEGGVADRHRRQEERALRDRRDQGGRGPARDHRDRPRDPDVRRRGRVRRLAARRDVRARAHPAPRRRSRRGAPPADRPPRAAPVRDLCAHESSHRIRCGDGGARGRRHALRRAGRRARTQRVRLDLVLGARDRADPRPDGRAVVRGRAVQEAQARHVGAGAPGAQPRAAGQAVGGARPAVGRARASRVRARRGGADGAAGVRRVPRRPRAVVRRGAPAPAPPVDRRRPSITTAHVSTTRACRSGRSRSSSRSTCGSVAEHRRSCAASAGWATGGSRASARRRWSPRVASWSRRRRPTPGRAIDPEHFGAMVFYARTDMPSAFARGSRSCAVSIPAK